MCRRRGPSRRLRRCRHRSRSRLEVAASHDGGGLIGDQAVDQFRLGAGHRVGVCGRAPSPSGQRSRPKANSASTLEGSSGTGVSGVASQRHLVLRSWPDRHPTRQPNPTLRGLADRGRAARTTSRLSLAPRKRRDRADTRSDHNGLVAQNLRVRRRLGPIRANPTLMRTLGVVIDLARVQRTWRSKAGVVDRAQGARPSAAAQSVRTYAPCAALRPLATRNGGRICGRFRATFNRSCPRADRRWPSLGDGGTPVW